MVEAALNYGRNGAAIRSCTGLEVLRREAMEGVFIFSVSKIASGEEEH